MSSRRSRSLSLFLAVAAAVSAGCGGGEHPRTAKDAARSETPAAPRASAPPIFDVDHLRTSLLPPKDVAARAKIQAPTYPGLTNATVPGCSASSVHLPGKPKTLARQLESRKPGYVAAAYIQLVAVYPDATAASDAMDEVRTKARACPAKHHFPAKRRGKKVIEVEHTDTWTTTEDTVAGWTHVRGFEKLLAPRSASKFNVFYNVYDYATRGNVLAASLYWERVASAAPGRPTADRATAVLTKQLTKFG